jgi:hypothetical protein
MHKLDNRDEVLRSMEAEIAAKAIDDPVDQILGTVSTIVDRAHKVALDQCQRARKAIDTAATEALRTIELLEETIEAKRSGTSDQFRAYLSTVRHAQMSAEDVHASAVAGITAVRESISRVSEEVHRLPAPSPAPSPVPADEEEPHEAA